MKKRLGKALVVLFMWTVFSAGAILVILAQLLLIGFWALTGNEYFYDWVKKTGKGTDAHNNGAWLGGNVKETISSHVGRWVEQGNPPLWARFINWLTGLVEENHCVKAIEEPFRKEPL